MSIQEDIDAKSLYSARERRVIGRKKGEVPPPMTELLDAAECEIRRLEQLVSRFNDPVIIAMAETLELARKNTSDLQELEYRIRTLELNTCDDCK